MRFQVHGHDSWGRLNCGQLCCARLRTAASWDAALLAAHATGMPRMHYALAVGTQNTCHCYLLAAALHPLHPRAYSRCSLTTPLRLRLLPSCPQGAQAGAACGLPVLVRSQGCCAG